MSAVAFDTLKFAQKLRDKANFSPTQAEGISEAFSEAIAGQLATRADLVALATKDDLAALGKTTKDDLAALGKATKDDLAALGKATKDDLAALGKATKDDLAALGKATKDDLAALGKATKDELTALGKELAAFKLETRNDFARLENKIEGLKTETLRWIVGAVGLQTIAVIGTFIGLVRFLVH